MRRLRPKNRLNSAALIIVALAGLAFAAAREDMLKARAQIRAFDGAPPAIPHEINPVSTEDCLDCHGPGGVGAPKISHRLMTHCIQCHTPTEQAGLARKKTIVENSFAGLPPPASGSRAFAGAPPMIPHATAMRGNCLACHGPEGPAALRTPHPERQICVQCHLSPAARE